MRFILVWLFMLISAFRSEAALRALVTLPPLYSLVYGITKGISTPILLLDGLVSPHHYTLKPSDRRKIEEANLIIWIGPHYEFFLKKTIEQSSAPTIQLDKISTLIRLPQRSSSHCTHCDHDHKNSNDVIDPHLWLTPLNAQKFVEVITHELSRLDPENRTLYNANAKTLIAKLELLDQELRHKLAPLKDKAFFVYHDGYQYFEKAYNLKGLGSLTLDPEIPMSVQRLHYIEEQIKKHKVQCLFGEMQFHPPLIKTLAVAFDIKTGQLDPFGVGLTNDETLYFKMMLQLADSFCQCLGENQ